MDKMKEVLHLHNFIKGQQQSKEWITLSLLYLMETKIYSDIKVTEIAKKSGLARQTLYRNYQEKDDILYEYLCHQMDFFDRKINERQLTGAAVLIAFFELWQQFVPDSLFKNIQSSDRKIRQIIYRSLEYFVHNKYAAHFMPPHTTSGELHYYVFRSLASVLHGILIEWSLQFYQQPPEEIGKLTYELTDSIRQYSFQNR